MSIIHGDCIAVMGGMDAETVDAVVCDPPYGLGFMGKAWDNTARMASRPPSADRMAHDPYPRTGKGPAAVAFDGRAFQTWCFDWAEAALRVAKPSAYLLAFGGTRTVHRMTVALEDAGWIIRDMLVWAYASGFPKSKASLKPAWEPIVMARKPGPLRMLNIDECRIPFADAADAADAHDNWARSMDLGHVAETVSLPTKYVKQPRNGVTSLQPQPQPQPHEDGRWPANVILTDPIFDGGVAGVVGGGEASTGGSINGRPVTGYSKGWADERYFESYGDSGTYSRFFLIPKADRTDREPVLRTDREPVLRTDRELPFDDFNRNVGNVVAKRRENAHPTVKPTDLMRHLVRLVTPRVPIWTCSGCGAVLEYDHAVQQSSTKPDVRDVRQGVLRGPQADEVLRTEVRGDGGSSWTLQLPGLDHEPGGVHPGETAGSPDGEPRGLRHAASSDRSRDAGSDAAADRGRRSHERDQGRQPAGEPSRHGQAGARQSAEASEEADQLSALRRAHSAVGSDSACDGRLVPGERLGTVLDPFLGSGTTGLACELEGFPWIGIEKEAEYVAIAEARLNGTQRGMGLVG